jgi:hypothetical protein
MMSHFSVFVTVPQMNPAAPIHVDELEDRVATILARYDEQTEETYTTKLNKRSVLLFC